VFTHAPETQLPFEQQAPPSWPHAELLLLVQPTAPIAVTATTRTTTATAAPSAKKRFRMTTPPSSYVRNTIAARGAIHAPM
jgi:hypothetical protein